MAYSDVFNDNESNTNTVYGGNHGISASDRSAGDFFFDAPVNRGTVDGGRNTRGRRGRSYADFFRNIKLPEAGSVGDFFRSISPEHWVDIVCIPLTLAGLIFIIANFEVILEALFSFLYPVIEGVLFVLLIAAVIGVLYLIFRRRRRFYW